jgi:oxalate decarboxylase/phosphoglucose isomerase-like protein (cupin superfamily)
MSVVSQSRFLVMPGGGDAIYDGPIGTTIKVRGSETNGVLSICEMPVAPGFMVPPHVHRNFDEWSYVLDGRIGAPKGDDELTPDPG